MIVTTTPFIENHTIEKYLGLINVNQVVGANFFADLFASFSDVFGGNSGAYREQLNNLYQSVLNALIIKAKHLGANAIIGVSFDFDEVSGKNKSMFMVTAVGTAVITTFSRYEVFKKLHEIKQYFDEGLLDEEEYKMEESRIKSIYQNKVEIDGNEIKRQKEIEKQAYEDSQKKEKERELILEKQQIIPTDLMSEAKSLNGFNVGDLIMVVETEEFKTIEGFTNDGRIICIMGDDITIYSFDNISKIDFS